MRANIVRAYKTLSTTKWLSSIAIGILSAGILGWLVYKGYPYLRNYRWDINWSYLPVIFLVYSLDLLLVVFLWSSIFRALGNHDHFLTHLNRYAVSNLARRIPGTIWYVLYRVKAYTDSGIPPLTTTAGAAIEAAISIVSAAIITIVFAMQVFQEQKTSPWIISLMLILCLALIYPKNLKWLLRKLKSPQTEINYEALLLWSIGHAIVWILGGMLLYLIIQLFYPLELSKLGYVIGCFALTGLISRGLLFLPTNLGFTEVSLSVLFSIILPTSIAVIAALTNRILVTVMEIVWVIGLKSTSFFRHDQNINP